MWDEYGLSLQPQSPDFTMSYLLGVAQISSSKIPTASGEKQKTNIRHKEPGHKIIRHPATYGPSAAVPLKGARWQGHGRRPHCRCHENLAGVDV